MSLREAAQQALVDMACMRDMVAHPDNLQFIDNAITALRAALAEPERKPLTDEEIDALPLPPSGTATVRDIVRLIERAHGIGGEA
jgi:hypothetical protein